jgi:hypothetical protein
MTQILLILAGFFDAGRVRPEKSPRLHHTAANPSHRYFHDRLRRASRARVKAYPRRYRLCRTAIGTVVIALGHVRLFVKPATAA